MVTEGVTKTSIHFRPKACNRHAKLRLQLLLTPKKPTVLIVRYPLFHFSLFFFWIPALVLQASSLRRNHFIGISFVNLRLP